MLPERLQQMAAIAAGQGPLSREAVQLIRGEPMPKTRGVTVRDGVATVAVVGPIFRRANLFSMFSGGTSLEVLARDLREAAAGDQVKAIILELDTPGGEAAGICEAAALVRTLSGQKPLHAYVDGDACSGGYWLASACESVVCSPTAVLGSVGVVVTLTNAQDPERLEIVSAQSPNKRPDLATEEGRGEYQRLADELCAVFVADVARYRGVSEEKVLSDFGAGGLRVGKAAVQAGLADRVSSYEALQARLAGRTLRQSMGLAGGPLPVRRTQGRRDAGTQGGAAMDDTQVLAASAEDVDALRAEVATRAAAVERMEGELRRLSAENAGLQAAEQRRAVEARLQAVQLLDGGAVIAPKSRAALADAVMGLAVDAREPVLAAVAGLQVQNVGTLGGGFEEDGEAAVQLTAAERNLAAAEARQKNLPAADVEKAFLQVKRERLARAGG